jgi:nucleoid DNA-binding protein
LTRNKADLADALRARVAGLSRAESQVAVDAFFDVIKDLIVGQGALKLSGFGKFEVRTKAARIGRSPQTHQPMPLGARRVLKFRASPVLRKAVNSPDAPR